MTESTIWNWEANRSSPQLRFIPRIIAFLGYNPHDAKPGPPGEGPAACCDGPPIIAAKRLAAFRDSPHKPRSFHAWHWSKVQR